VTVYFISGLGADRKAFQKLRLPDTVQVRYIDWMEPTWNESLTTYCNRLSKSVNTSEEFILVGLSFGGMIAIEMAKVLRPKQVIIISSVVTHQELPVIYKLIGRLGLHKIAPSFLYKNPNVFVYWFFGARTAAERRLFRHILYTSSPLFLKWALDKVLLWRNEQRPDHLFHIHGTGDRIFPLKLTKADAKVEGGKHFMVYSEADVISRILREQLGISKDSVQ
jgi:pimeloyl-ACP methyl ester carboxylesterase